MSEHRIALITDSASDLPDDVLAQHDIDFVPLYIIWGEESLRDRVDITPDEFYQRLVSDPQHPTTSQPHPQDFAQAIQRAQEKGAEEAVIITVSSGMSSTYNSALQAAQIADLPVHVYDSRANSLTQGFQLLAAARVRDVGGDSAGDDCGSRSGTPTRRHTATR